jgi:hypothetical protein
MALTAILIPSFVNLLFLKDWSPFQETYNRLHWNYYHYFYTDTLNTFNNDFTTIITKPLRRDLQRVINAVFKIYHGMLHFNVASDPDLSFADILDEFERPEFKEIADNFRHNLREIFNAAMWKEEREFKWVLKKKEVEQYSLLELFDLVEQHINEFDAEMSEVHYLAASRYAPEMAQLEMGKFLMVVKISLAMFAQYLFIEPTFNNKKSC